MFLLTSFLPGRWDCDDCVVIGPCSIGTLHLKAFHAHLCTHINELLERLCKGTRMSARDVFRMVCSDEQPTPHEAHASDFMGACCTWPTMDCPAAKRWAQHADALLCALMVLIHIDGGEKWKTVRVGTGMRQEVQGGWITKIQKLHDVGAEGAEGAHTLG